MKNDIPLEEEFLMHLQSGEISFANIVGKYIDYLMNREDKERNNSASLAANLCELFYAKTKKQKESLKNDVVLSLLESGFFTGTKREKEWLKIIKKYEKGKK